MGTEAHERVLRALQEVESWARGVESNFTGDAKALLESVKQEVNKSKARSDAMVLAIVRDEYCPAALFKPWASVASICRWGREGKLHTKILHNRTCVRPSEFFRYFGTLTGDEPATPPDTTSASKT